jgi:hypothetical protein
MKAILSVLVVICLVPIMIVCGPFLAAATAFEAWRVPRWRRWRLARQGRSIPWSDCAERFAQGRGTLIVQYLWSPGSDEPILEWWTNDDVIANFPGGLPTAAQHWQSHHDPASYHEHAREFTQTYLDLETGAALVTQGPKRAGWTYNGGKGRELKRTYPCGKVVTVFRTTQNWSVVQGDADEVFSDPVAGS